MKNANQFLHSWVARGITIAGVKEGDIVQLGTAGLYGIALTDTYVEADYLDTGSKFPQTPPASLADGQATILLPGVALVMEVTAEAALGAYAKAYLVVSGGDKGKVNGTATSQPFVGYTLAAIAADAKGMLAVMAGGS